MLKRLRKEKGEEKLALWQVCKNNVFVHRVTVEAAAAGQTWRPAAPFYLRRQVLPSVLLNTGNVC